MKMYISALLIVLILLVGCATKQQTEPNQQQTEPKEQQTEPKEQIPEPKEETPTQTQPPKTEEPTVKIPNDIKEILEKGKTKLKSYSYNYKKPESDLTYSFSVKGNNIKITLPETNTEDKDKRYNTIYLDTQKKTAQAYCTGYSDCEGKAGKVKDINYQESYIETPLDWVKKVTRANVIDERQVEGRKSVYLETNIGKITVESYYGFLYKIEEGNKVWEFTDTAFNGVKDSEVIPS